MIVNGFMVFDTVFTTLEMIQLLESKLIAKHPKLMQYIVSGYFKLYWKTDFEFLAENHVWKFPQADGIAMNQAELDQLVGQYYNRTFPVNRSPYEFIVVENFQIGQSAVIFRFHHSLADGIGFIKMMIDASDMKQQPIQIVGNKSLQFWRKVVEIPLAILKQHQRKIDVNLLHGPVLSGDRQVASSDPIDLVELKEIKNRLGCTINDLLMTALAGAF